MIKQVKKALHYFMYDLKMRKKFFVIYCIFTIIPFVLFAFASGAMVSRRLYHSEVNSMNATIRQTKDLMIDRLSRIIESTYTIYLDDNLYHYLSADDRRAEKYEAFRIEEKLSTIVEGGDVLSASLYLYDRNKLPEPSFRSQSMIVGEEMYWYKKLEESGKKSLWDFTSSGIYYISSIYNKYDGDTLVGYIVIVFSSDVIMDALENLNVTENSMACIVNENGEILVSTDSQAYEVIKEEARKINLTDTSDVQTREYTVGADKYIVSGICTEEGNMPRIPRWDVLLWVPYSEMVPFADNIVYVIFLCSVLCIFVLNFVVSKIIGSITNRLEKLSQNMKSSQTGDFSCNDIPIGSDEISELRKNFNYMLAKTKKMLDEIVRANEREKDMELTMLQAQINPHFLYNTLDMINWAAISKTPEDIPEITSMLAKFYKLSLNNGARIVALKDEIQHVILYIGIQNKRYDSALDLQLNIPKMYENCACLKIILQPIVENAVLHGIFEKDEPVGKIIIEAYKKEDDLFLTVWDDGIGLTADELEELRRKVQGRDSGKGGYGLSNIEDRIRLCYGKEYGLTFESEEGKYTKVIIRIRYKEYQDSLKMNTKIQG